MHYRKDIDGLRGIAILMVIGFHLHWLKKGFLGVDIFFVISGFLITQLLMKQVEEKKFSLISFWVRRSRRLLPQFILMMIFSLFIGYFILLPNDLLSLGRAAIAAVFFSANHYFWLKTGYFTPPASTQPLLHIWSLAIEEQFYMAWPLLLMLIANFTQRNRFFSLFSIFIIFFIFAIYLNYFNEDAAFFLLPSRCFEFLFGVLIAMMIVDGRFKLSSSLAKTLIYLGIFIAIIIYNSHFGTMINILSITLVTALLIFCHHEHVTIFKYLLQLLPLTIVGLLSYALYIWHWPIIVFVEYMHNSMLSRNESLTLFFSIFVIGTLTYSIVEKPFMEKKYLKNNKNFILILSIIILFILMISSYFLSGLPSRFNKSLQMTYKKAFFEPKSTCKKIYLTPHLSVCSLNPKQPPDLVVWGDSHAHAIFPAIEQLANFYHVNVWLYQCIPVFNVYKSNEAKRLSQSSCFKSNNAWQDYLKNHAIKQVLLISFWSQFTEGIEIPMHGAGETSPFYSDEETHAKTKEEARLIFKRHFMATIHHLLNANTNIWIMKQVPAHLYWVSNEVVKKMRYGGNLSSIGRSYVEYKMRQDFVDKIFASVESNQVHLLDPSQLLCTNDLFCHGTFYGEPLYSDFNHLSYQGSLFLMPLLEPIFQIISHQLS